MDVELMNNEDDEVVWNGSKRIKNIYLDYFDLNLDY